MPLRLNRLSDCHQVLRRGLVALAVVLVTTIGPQSGGHAGDSPPLQGHFADNFILSQPPKPAPAVTFSDLEGQAVTLNDFAGQAVLLNFWATWCAPCVHEMPSLDRLQAALGPEGLKVVALSVDRGGRATVEPFLARLGIEHLEAFLDPKNTLAQDFAVPGLPTTYLIDPQGRMVGAMAGPAEWDSPEAEALIRHYLPDVPGGGEGELLKTEGECTTCAGPKAAKARLAKSAADGESGGGTRDEARD